MSCYQQLTAHDKARVTRCFVKIAYQLYPSLRTHINAIIRLILRKASPHDALISVILQHIGRASARKVKDVAIAEVINAALKERMLYDNNKRTNVTVCHACFSYYVQCKCSNCGRLSLCAGCIDYDTCLDCEVDAM